MFGFLEAGSVHFMHSSGQPAERSLFLGVLRSFPCGEGAASSLHFAGTRGAVNFTQVLPRLAFQPHSVGRAESVAHRRQFFQNNFKMLIRLLLSSDGFLSHVGLHLVFLVEPHEYKFVEEIFGGGFLI